MQPARAESKYMFLTVTDYEAGISYRQVQSHAPIGLLIQSRALTPIISRRRSIGTTVPENTSRIRTLKRRCSRKLP